MEYPQVNHLYKYCAYNTNYLSILINKKIWVAKPGSFNDPFDCKIRFKRQKNPETISNFLRQTGRSSGTVQGDYEIYQKGTEDFLEKDVPNFGVFSMSQIKDNILMWAHYANHHKGFCIEFVRSPDNLLGNSECTQPVNYCCDYPEVDSLNSSGNRNYSIRNKICFTKAKDWGYEKEWRFIYDEGDKAVHLPADISSIIFGLKMPDEHKIIIRKILTDQPNIRYQEAIKVEYQFRLKIIDCKADK